MRGALLVVALALVASLAVVRVAGQDTFTVPATATVSVSNELRGCETNPNNITVEFLEDGERTFALLKFDLQLLSPPKLPPESVVLHLFTVESDKDVELNGRLEVVPVKNNWDPSSVSCATLPEEVDDARPRKLSGLPWDTDFSLDITEFVQQALDADTRTLALLVRPEDNSGEIHIDFGSTSAWHNSLHLTPELVVRAKDVPRGVPELRAPAVPTVIAGEPYSLEVRVPHADMETTPWGQRLLPSGKLVVKVRNGPSGSEIPSTFTEEHVNEAFGFTSFALRFTPTKAGPIYATALWESNHVTGSPVIVSCSPGDTDAAHCYTDFGTPEYFQTHPLPKVGVQTCFDLHTQDAYDNPTVSDVTVEVLAGVDDKPSAVSTSRPMPGVLKVCFTPADADVVSVSAKLAEETMVTGFPVEVDCVPGSIVPEKTQLHEDDPLEVVAGVWSEFRMTTFDEADHVSNIDRLDTRVEFTGPGEVHYNISVVGPPSPQTGESVVHFRADTVGFYDLRVFVHGGTVLGPFNVTVHPAAPVASRAVVVKNQLTAVAGQPNSFEVASFDEFGNHVVSGGLDLQLVVEPLTVGKDEAQIEHDVVDSSDGSYTITWMAEKTDTYQVTLRHETDADGEFDVVEGCPFNVTVFPGPMSPAASGFLKRPPQTLAAGEAGQFLVRERDAFGNSLTEQDPGYVLAATCTAQDTGDVHSVPLEWLNDGTASVAVNLRKAGTYLVDVKANGTSIDQATLTVVPGPACPFASIAAHDFGTGAAVNNETLVTLRLRDSFGNDLVSGGLSKDIRVEAIHAGAQPVRCKITDLGDGRYTASLTPTVVGSYNVYVYLHGVAVGDSPYSLWVRPGAPFGPFSYVVGESLRSAVAGQSGRLLLRTRDQGKNDVNRGGALVVGFLERHADAESDSTTSYAVAFTDNGDGTYSGEYNATEAGDYSLFVRVGGNEALGSPFALRVSPNAIGAQTVLHTAHLVEESPRAGDRVSLTVRSYDRFGNARRVGGDDLVVSFAHRASGLVSFATVTDLRNGTYVAALELTKAGEYSIAARNVADDAEFSRATGGLQFSVVPAAPSGEHSTVAGPGLVAAVAGETARVWVTLRDTYYNEQIVGGANVTATLVPLSAHVLRLERFYPVGVDVSDEGNGTYVLSYTAYVAADYLLRVLVTHEEGGEAPPAVPVVVQGTPTTVRVAPTVASGGTSKLTGPNNGGNKRVVAGTVLHFVLHARDEYGNEVARGGDSVVVKLSGVNVTDIPTGVRDDGNGAYYARTTPTAVGVYGVVGFINGQRVPSDDFLVRVTPARTSGAACTARWADLDVEIEAGVSYSFPIFPADSFGNPTNGTDGAWVLRTASSLERTVGNVTVRGGAGDAEVQGRLLATRAGEAQVHLLFNDVPVGGSPHTVRVWGTWTAAERSSATGGGLHGAHAGTPANFRIKALDQFGNLATKGPVNVEVSDADGFELAIKTQELDGEYNVTYVPVAAGPHTVEVKVGEEHLPGSPFRVLVLPGATSGARSQVFGPGITVVRATTDGEFFVLARDAFGNPRFVGGDNVTASSTPVAVSFEAEDLGDGTYRVRYTAPAERLLLHVDVFINDQVVGANHSVSVVDVEADPFVYVCPQNCTRTAQGRCDASTGLCDCLPGWSGVDCAQKFHACALGCSGHGDCDYLTGKCYCSGGYSGDACEIDPAGSPTWEPPATAGSDSGVKVKASRPGPKCPGDGRCSGNGQCVRGPPEDHCECNAGFVGAECETRTFYSLLALDHGFVLVYEISTGQLTIYQQGIAEDKSCSGLNRFDAGAGAGADAAAPSSIFRPAQRKYVYIGGTEMLEVDPVTHVATLLRFDYEALAKGVLLQPEQRQLGSVSTFQDKESVYLGMNRLLVSSEDSSTVFRLNRDGGDQVFVSEQGVHRWAHDGLHGRYFYAGHDYVARFREDGRVALYSFERPTAGISEPAAYNATLAVPDGFDRSGMQVVALSGDVWLAFDHKTADYLSYYCPTGEDRAFGGCTFLNAGSVRGGYKCAAVPKAEACADLSRLGCVQSKKCGFCLQTQQCVEGSETGPANGTCAAPDGTTMWVYTTNEFAVTYERMGPDHVASFEAATGKYTVWSLALGTKSQSCRALEDSVASGYLQNTINHNVLFVGDNILDFNPGTGKFRMALCDAGAIAATGQMQCATWADGEWPQLKGRRLAVIRVANSTSTSPSGAGRPTLLLDYDAATGDYRVWDLASRADFETGVPLMRDAPLAQENSPGLVAADVTVLPGLGSIVVAHQSITSTTTFYEIIGSVLVRLREPVAKGIKMVVVDGRKRLLQTRFASMGGNLLLQYGPLGYWKLLECYPYAVLRDEFGPDAPFHCTAVSSGSPNPPLCASKTSETACTANPSCGWCKDTLKCFHGYSAGVCSKAEAVCPYAAWRHVAGEEKGGFIGSIVESEGPLVPEHNCGHSTSCRACVADSQCGWHTASKTCVLGGPKGPKDQTRYPVSHLDADWSYYFCKGLEGCAVLSDSCGDCAAVSFCGYCGSAHQCMPGTLVSPLLENCGADWTFDRTSCPAEP